MTGGSRYRDLETPVLRTCLVTGHLVSGLILLLSPWSPDLKTPVLRTCLVTGHLVHRPGGSDSPDPDLRAPGPRICRFLLP